jgi:hypothetical protein
MNVKGLQNEVLLYACSHALPDVVETHPATDTLSSLLELVAALMSYSDLPVDAHNNCGMVLVLLVVLLDSTGGEWCKVSLLKSI